MLDVFPRGPIVRPAGHANLLADANERRLTDVVEPRQRGDRGLVPSCDTTERFAPPHGVDRDAAGGFCRPDARTAGRDLQALSDSNQVGTAQAVEAGERPDVGSVQTGDTAQRLPAAHPVRGDRRGLAVGLRVRVERGVPGKEAVFRAGGNAQCVAAWHVQVAAANQAAEGLVEPQQIVPIERGRGRHVVQRHEVRQFDLVVRQRRLALDGSEIPLRVLLDLDGRQQLGIKIPRSKTERPAVVTSNDRGDVARPQPPHRAFHPRPAVIVGGHGQRPSSQRGIIVPEESGRGVRSQ